MPNTGVSIVIDLGGTTWTIDVADLLMLLLIGALALGAVLVLIVQVQATIKGGPARRKFRDDMRAVRQRTAERKAREAAPPEPEPEPEPESPRDYAWRKSLRRTSVEMARRRRLRWEGWAERAGWSPESIGYIPPSLRYDATRPGEIQRPGDGET